MTGETANEGLFFAYQAILDETDAYFRDLDANWTEIWCPNTLDIHHDDIPTQNKICQDIRQHYLQENSVSRDRIAELTEIYSDRLYRYSVRNLILQHYRTSNSQTFVYNFAYVGGKQKILEPLLDGQSAPEGASHGEEMIYIFRLFDAEQTDDQDGTVRQQMVELWTHFATNLYPDEIWQSWSEENSEQRIIDVESRSEHFNLRVDMLEFWSSVDKRLREESNTKDEL